MNKILPLFDEEFVVDLFKREILPHYPEFIGIKGVNINPYKKLVWKTTYHVVIGFETYFLRADGEEVKILIVCSAHSGEPRAKVYLALKYLWAVGFPNKFIELPKPLFYSEEFKGTFYRGLEGENLLYYIQNKNVAIVREIIIGSAKLFARLHALTNFSKAKFDLNNSRIKTVIPGIEIIFKEMGKRYNNKYNHDLVKIYDYFIKHEEKYLSSGVPLVLIHGDAHSENIIRTAFQHLGLIDFTDLCLADRARDLGTFIQQLEYKFIADDADWANKMKDLFLSTYLEAAKLESSANLQARIRLYYDWTSIRTAIYWFLKADNEEDLAKVLLDKVKTDLKL